MLTAAVNTKALWYLTRGTGLATLVLLTLSVVLGVTETVRWASPRWPRFVTAALHKNVSLLVMVLLAIHIVTSVVDGFVTIRWIDAVVPFISAYRAVWLGLGALGFDLLAALIITSLVRERIGYRAWRAIHWAAYACWPASVVHGLGTGSDTRLGWVLLLNLGCLVAVVAAVWWRLGVGWDASGARTTAALASVTAPVLMVAWLVTGPLKSGWARRAGTPVTVLAGASAPAGSSGTTSGAAATAGLQPPFTAQLSGTLAERGPDANGLATVTIGTTLSGGAAGQLSLVLQGQPTAGGGIRMSQSSATLGPANQPTEYQGRISSLNGASMVAVLQDGSGRRVRLAIQLAIAGSNVSGSVQASAGTDE